MSFKLIAFACLFVLISGCSTTQSAKNNTTDCGTKETLAETPIVVCSIDDPKPQVTDEKWNRGSRL